METVFSIVLSVCALQDARSRKIYLWLPGACAAVGTGVFLYGQMSGRGTLTSTEWIAGLLIGLVILAVVEISGGKIGKGDGLILLACGVCLGWKRQLALMFGAAVLFLIFGIAGIMAKRWTAGTRLAFVPFLWLAYAGTWIVEMIF